MQVSAPPCARTPDGAGSITFERSSRVQESHAPARGGVHGAGHNQSEQAAVLLHEAGYKRVTEDQNRDDES
jgi:hypothetical protein